ncbi:MAG: hypothetical protein JWP83_3262 [Mycobacterium sp.]|jgi:hypothetical protein|nr:hypothetical protein [Mycobacterium sp.]
MSVVVAAACAALMMIVATGIYNLQWWLERSDYNRHFED